jgi:FlaA1/EpsC-like NDP-sugar epimerase
VRCILCVNIAGTCCSMRIGIAGAGGHAKVVADALLAVGQIEFAGFLDDDPDSWGSQILGYRVLAPITAWSERKIDALVVAVGDNARRKQIFEQLTAAGDALSGLCFNLPARPCKRRRGRPPIPSVINDVRAACLVEITAGIGAE